MMQQLSLGVEADQLAAGPEARVYGHQALLSHRSGKEQLAQVGTENLYGFNVRLLFRAAYEFIAHRRFQQTLVGVLDSGAQLFGDGGRREAAFLAEIVVYLVAGLLGILVYMQADETLVLRPEHSQEPMGSHFRKQLAAVEEGTVFLGLRILAAGFCRLEYYAAAAHHSPQGLAHGCAVGEFLGYYVPGTGKGGLHVSGLSFPAAESFRLCGRILAAHFIYEQGQRLEPCLFGGGGPGAALRPPRKVEVFHFPGIHRVLYPGAKFRGERVSLLYGLKYQLLALVEFSIGLGPVTYLSNGDLVQSSSPFLAVAADERNGRALFEELYAILYLPAAARRLFGNGFYIYILHISVSGVNRGRPP